MPSASRVGTGLLGAFGVALAALMAYTLAFEGWGGGATVPDPVVEGADEVAVFFPDRHDWTLFRRAVAACVARGLAREVGSVDDSVWVATPKLGRRVRFAWHGVRGVGEAGEDVEALLRADPGPIALVGSSTTVLTATLAEALGRARADGPPLLVPWASSVRGRGWVPLLDLAPGQVFRFCPDNVELADAVVACLIAQDGGNRPGRAFLVVDPHDPYSVDLADGFRRAIRAEAPDTEIVHRPDAVGAPTVARSPGSEPSPTPEERALAEEIASAVDSNPGDRPTWAVLPLHGEPARRMLSALRSTPAGQGKGPLRVVCGDGIGRETLAELAKRRGPPVYCAATASATRTPGLGLTDDSLQLAEVVSALLLAVDQSPLALREALAKLDMPASDPSAFGRPIAFEPGGERRGPIAAVLAIRPGSAGVVEFSKSPDGGWRPDDGGRP